MSTNKLQLTDRVIFELRIIILVLMQLTYKVIFELRIIISVLKQLTYRVIFELRILVLMQRIRIMFGGYFTPTCVLFYEKKVKK